MILFPGSQNASHCSEIIYLISIRLPFLSITPQGTESGKNNAVTKKYKHFTAGQLRVIENCMSLTLIDIQKTGACQLLPSPANPLPLRKFTGYTL